MELPRRRFLQLAVTAAVIPAAADLAEAQSWPNRVVRVVVGLPAGGGADAVARILANRLSEICGQQVIVENRSGASGTLAYDAVAHAAPDGYTILLAARAPELNQLLFSSIDHKAADFAPVTLIGKFLYLLVVPPSSPVNSLQEFVSHARANPGKVPFASTGIGTLPHLAGELLKRAAGIEMTHVPYRGVAAGAMNDLLAGRGDAMFNALASLLQPVRAGQVRALAVTTAERFPAVHELPTFAESDVRGLDVASWYAFYLPAKTPPEIIKKHDDSPHGPRGQDEVRAARNRADRFDAGSTCRHGSGRCRAVRTDYQGTQYQRRVIIAHHPSSNVVTPNTRSRASGRIAPVYIRAVSNTGARSCPGASATASGLTLGTSRKMSPAPAAATKAASTPSAAARSSATSGPILWPRRHGRITPQAASLPSRTSARPICPGALIHARRNALRGPGKTRASSASTVANGTFANGTTPASGAEMRAMVPR